MTIRFACPTCAATYAVSDRKAGKKTSCPKCGQRIVVPGTRPPSATGPIMGFVVIAMLNIAVVGGLVLLIAANWHVVRSYLR